MSEFAFSASVGKVSEHHDKREFTPTNAESFLAKNNFHWQLFDRLTDAEAFDKIYEPTVEKFNAKQTRDDRKMGKDSSKPERQKTYYQGLTDGTFATGSKKNNTLEQPFYEVVLQIGNGDDNGITNKKFDIKHYRTLKNEGKNLQAETYVQLHLIPDEQQEKTKRILQRSVERIKEFSPEHLVVLRADGHFDEPCGTGHVHLCFTLRSTEYKKGMEERCAAKRALRQMGFADGISDKELETKWVTLIFEKFKDIMEEEALQDAKEHGYEPMIRKEDTDEHREHIPSDVFTEIKLQEAFIDEKVEELGEREANLVFEEESVEARKKNVSNAEIELGQAREKFSHDEEKLEKDKKEFEKNKSDFEQEKTDFGKEKEEVERKSSDLDLRESVVATLENSLNTRRRLFEREKQKVDKEKEELKTQSQSLQDWETNLENREYALELNEESYDMSHTFKEEDLRYKQMAMERRQKDLDAQKADLDERELTYSRKKKDVDEKEKELKSKEIDLGYQEDDLDVKQRKLERLYDQQQIFTRNAMVQKEKLDIYIKEFEERKKSLEELEKYAKAGDTGLAIYVVEGIRKFLGEDENTPSFLGDIIVSIKDGTYTKNYENYRRHLRQKMLEESDIKLPDEPSDTIDIEEIFGRN